MVAWAMFPETALTLTQGQPKTINSSGTAMRSFCADCGSGLFYRNAAVLPDIVDVQSGTLDHPEALPPTVQIQTAERLGWMQHVHALPEFERYPAHTLPQLMSEHKDLNLPADTEWVDAPELPSEVKTQLSPLVTGKHNF